jgi:hypothetical protein
MYCGRRPALGKLGRDAESIRRDDSHVLPGPARRSVPECCPRRSALSLTAADRYRYSRGIELNDAGNIFFKLASFGTSLIWM